MTEEQRRKAFIKAAHDVIKVWPGYAAHQLPAPDNRTDQCIQCDMRFSQQVLIETWQDCRAGKATDDDFSDAVMRWMSARIFAAEVFSIGKPGPEYALERKTRETVQGSRAKCKFRRAVKIQG